jgi:hypothetical protein
VLYEIAEGQSGYFTAAQAKAAGLHQVRLVQLAKQGDIERETRGVYRFTRFPVTQLGHYMAAVLYRKRPSGDHEAREEPLLDPYRARFSRQSRCGGERSGRPRQPGRGWRTA